jgi:hypothetical protein
MADMWTVDTMKAAFLGVTAHWTEVKGKKWEMHSEVVGFRLVSGAHSGKNLGQYFMGVCDRIGIMNMKQSKVQHYLSDHNRYISDTLTAPHHYS